MLVLLLSVALSAGFRVDGTGHVADAHPALGDVRWKLPLDAPGNASVVGFGDDVCFTADPATVRCVDAATGTPHWEASHPVVDAIAADPATRAKVDAAVSAAAALDALRASLGPLTKRARGGDGMVKAELADVRARIAAAEALVVEVAPMLTLPVEPANGWSAPTPVTDGEHLWVMFGNGVVACHAGDGTLVWRRWLGPHDATLAFFAGVPTASPVLVDGVLVVAYGALRGLDADTGAERWVGPRWEDYGSPSAMDVGGLSIVVTPAGDVVRARDGVVLLTGLSQRPWFNAPLVDGDVVWWVGGQYVHPKGFRASARSVSLARTGDTVVATPRTDVPLPSHERFYAGPIVFDDRVVSVDNTGRLLALDRASGAIVSDTQLDVGSQVWGSSLAVDGKLWVPVLDGTFLVLDPALTVVARVSVGDRTLAAPWLAGDRMWVRSHGALWAL